MDFSITFLNILFWGIYLIGPVLVLLGSTVILLGLIVGRIESWSKFDAIYWSFITALTVGYGDIRPLKKASRLLATLIALLGIMFTGIVVAITLEATSAAFETHVDPSSFQHLKEN